MADGWIWLLPFPIKTVQIWHKMSTTIINIIIINTNIFSLDEEGQLLFVPNWNKMIAVWGQHATGLLLAYWLVTFMVMANLDYIQANEVVVMVAVVVVVLMMAMVICFDLLVWFLDFMSWYRRLLTLSIHDICKYPWIYKI